MARSKRMSTTYAASRKRRSPEKIWTYLLRDLNKVRRNIRTAVRNNGAATGNTTVLELLGRRRCVSLWQAWR